jgi:hypothetical protein
MRPARLLFLRVHKASEQWAEKTHLSQSKHFELLQF